MGTIFAKPFRSRSRGKTQYSADPDGQLWLWRGVYGGGVLRGAATPNIDSIAAEGIQLTNFNVEAECTPSRAALMTGRYGIRTRQTPGGTPYGMASPNGKLR